MVKLYLPTVIRGNDEMRGVGREMVEVAERHLVEKDVSSLNMFWVEVYWNHLLGTRFLVNREVVEIDRDRTPQEIETEGYVRYSFTLDIIKKINSMVDVDTIPYRYLHLLLLLRRLIPNGLNVRSEFLYVVHRVCSE